MDQRTGMPQVGMVGGGQLARMTHQAAIALGQGLRVLAVDPHDSAALITPDVQLGSHTDLAALRSFAQTCDVVTFDHEHVPTEHIQTLTDEGFRVYPGAQALVFAQDKGLMRQQLSDLDMPVPPFALLANPDIDSINEFGRVHGWPVVVKSRRGGYDGRGVWVLRDPAHAAQTLDNFPDVGQLLVEGFVPMKRELAAVVARSPFGQAAGWPVVETVQEEGICVEVIAPAPDLGEQRSLAATALALRLAERLAVVGILAVELFEVEPSETFPDGLIINELAMRPHNSGHWTMDGSVTSQFEQHLRAVLDYPLGRTDMTMPVTVMVNIIGGSLDSPGAGIGMDERIHHLAARFPEVKVHMYGKSFRPGRKLGHINIGGSDLAVIRRIGRLAGTWLSEGVWADGFSIHGQDRRLVTAKPYPANSRSVGQ